MDVLKKNYEQLRDLFIGMTPGNRITTGLLLAILLVSLGYLLVSALRPAGSSGGSGGNTVFLYDAKYFSTPEMHKVAEALGKEGLKYQWNEGRLEVPKKDADKYMTALADAGAVTDPSIFKRNFVSNMGPYLSSKQMDLQDREATERQLERMLAQKSWVQYASVSTNIRYEMETHIFHRRKVISAVVQIMPKDGLGLTPERVSDVTATVAPAFGITNHREISITDALTGRHSYGSDQWAFGGEQSYVESQKQQEQHWKRKIEELLPYIPGLIVQTTVDISDVKNRKEHGVAHDKPTPVAEKIKETELTKTGSSIGGQPGMEAQMGVPELIPRGGRTNSTSLSETTSNSEIARALQGVESTQERANYVPLSVLAAIQIPNAYFRNTWMSRNATAEEPNPEPTQEDLDAFRLEETARIKASIAKLVEQHRPKDILDAELQVNVSSYEGKPEPTPVVMSTLQLFALWFQANWETLGLLGLIMLGLIVLWTMTRVKQPEPIVIYEAPEIPVAEEAMSDEEIESDEELMRQRTLEPFDKSMRSLQTEAADLVTENPDAAASVLRQWIGNVSFQES